MLYGHQLSEYVVQTGKTIPGVAVLDGVKLEAYLSYLLATFPERSVQELCKCEGGLISNELLKEVSDSITLTKGRR